MVSIDKAVLARYSQGGHHFEIYVDPNQAMRMRNGESVSIADVLAANEVFKDAKKGDKASENTTEQVFGTKDVSEVARKIIQKGEIQLTTEQRRHMTEEKRKAIISIIAREAYNPQTKTPHPPQRIENAMDEARVSISPFDRAEEQVEKVISAIRPLIPISMERLKLDVLIPPEYTGIAYGHLRKYNLEREEWDNNGYLHILVVIPAGIEAEFYDEMNGLTKGQVQINKKK